MDDLVMQGYDQLEIEYDPNRQIVWLYMKPKPRPCFTLELLHNLHDHFTHLRQLSKKKSDTSGHSFPVRYQVFASKMPGVFNYGGDLSLFAELIRKQDGKKLYEYARLCIECVDFNNSFCSELPIITVSLVQGDALAGGLECALSSNIVIAERSAKFGLPEIIFNLFPGMGAYSLISRRLNATQAEKMILSGKTYSAEEFHSLGLVDVLAEKGQGKEALHQHLAMVDHNFNVYRAIYNIRQRVNPVTLEELDCVARLWVDIALALKESDLSRLERLVRAQQRKQSLQQDQKKMGT